jgi:hypothetical protein
MREESCRRKAVHFISRSDEFFAHQPPAFGTRAFIKYIRAPEHREAGPQPPLRCPRAHLRDSQSIELHVEPLTHDHFTPFVRMQLENALTTQSAHASSSSAQINDDVAAFVPQCALVHKVLVDIHGENACRPSPHKLPDSGWARRAHRGFIKQLRSNLRSLQKRVADVPGPKTLDDGHVVLFDAHLFDSTGAL